MKIYGVEITGSLSITGSIGVTDLSASYAVTASYALTSAASGSIESASYADFALSASYAATASLLLGSVVSSSYALSASYALNGGGGGTTYWTASGASISRNSDVEITGSLVINGNSTFLGGINNGVIANSFPDNPDTNIFNYNIWSISGSTAGANSMAAVFEISPTFSQNQTFGFLCGVGGRIVLRNDNAGESWAESLIYPVESRFALYASGTTLTSPYVGGVRSFISPHPSSTASFTNFKAYFAHFNKYADGLLNITNWYGYHSDPGDKHANTTLTNAWHFYGEGDYPSYFGGDIDVSGSTKFGNTSADIHQVTGSLNVTGGITGSLLGTASTASYVENAISSSYAVTASYVSGSSDSSVSSSYALSSSYSDTAQTLLGSVVSASYALTSSYAENAAASMTQFNIPTMSYNQSEILSPVTLTDDKFQISVVSTVQNEGIDANTMLMLSFDQSTGVIYDKTGRNTGLTTGSATTITFPLDTYYFGNSSAYFQNNNTAYIDVPYNSASFDMSGSYTIDFWIKPTAINRYHSVFSNGTGVDFRAFFAIIPDNTITWGQYVDGGNKFAADSIAIPNFQVGNWYHIAAVKNPFGNANQALFFINGELLSDVTSSEDWMGIESPIRIGTTYYPTTTTTNTYAHIDELRYSNNARWTASFGLLQTQYEVTASSKQSATIGGEGNITGYSAIISSSNTDIIVTKLTAGKSTDVKFNISYGGGSSSVSSSYALSASYSDTAQTLLGSVESASYAATASLLLGSVVSASYALSASYAPGEAGGLWTASLDDITRNSDVSITGSLNVTAGITGSLLGTALTASYYGGSVETSSYSLTAQTLLGSVVSASYAATASLLLGSVESASYALSSSYAGNIIENYWTASGADILRVSDVSISGSLDISGSVIITGSFIVSDTIAGQPSAQIIKVYSDDIYAVDSWNTTLLNDLIINLSSGSLTKRNVAADNVLTIGLTGTADVGSAEWSDWPKATENLFAIHATSTNTILGGIGAFNKFLALGGSAGSISTYINNVSDYVNWISGMDVTNYYAYYSKFEGTNPPANGWHFYGEGDYPSYFGGDITASGDTQIDGKLNVDGGITGSLLGTATTASYYGGTVETSSYSLTAQTLLGSVVSASYAATASLLLGSIESASYADFAVTASYVSGSSSVSSSYALSSSYADTAVTASYVSGSSSVSSSYALSSSYSDFALSSSYALTSDVSLFAGGFVTQSFVSDVTWSFAHNLGYQHVSFEIYDSYNEILIPGKFIAVDNNNAEIHFAASQSGLAIATFGGNVSTASYAVTASYAENAGGSGTTVYQTVQSLYVASSSATDNDMAYVLSTSRNYIFSGSDWVDMKIGRSAGFIFPRDDNLIFRWQANWWKDSMYLFENEIDNYMNALNTYSGSSGEMWINVLGKNNNATAWARATVRRGMRLNENAPNKLKSGDNVYFFIVREADSISDAHYFLHSQQQEDETSRLIFGENNTTGRLGIYDQLGPGWVDGSSGSYTADLHVYSLKLRDGEVPLAYMDNVLVISGTANYDAARTWNETSLLANGYNITGAEGHNYEIRIYSGSMSDAEFTAVGDELKIKYGI